MGKTNYRVDRSCACCGLIFVAESAAKRHCSVECRVKELAANFTEVGGCWDWPKSLNPVTGYGQLSSWGEGKRKLYTAHRVSFSAFIGEIPDRMMVCHTCDNRKCFNPAHLFLGTQFDNMRDCSAKGRFPSAHRVPAVSWQKRNPDKVPRGEAHHMFGVSLNAGEAHPMAKLTENQAREIKASDLKGVALSELYGVSGSVISAIRKGRTWKNL